MNTFSERMGLVKRALQKESMDAPLRNDLWSAAYLAFWREMDDWRRMGEDLALDIWVAHFHLRADEFPTVPIHVIAQIKARYLAGSWAAAYDLVEFIASQGLEGRARSYMDMCNGLLVRHCAAYRLVDGLVTPITSDEEIESIQSVILKGGRFSSAAEHIRTALARLSDRDSPDYRNSIKESVSAVESVCQVITGDSKATLGDALRRLGLHKALEKGFSAIYGYTSDADGIRHALLEESVLDADDARFFLVSCSAFVNYLISASEAKAP
jgi:hypothetical protein